MAGAALGLDASQMAMWRALLAASYFAIPATQCTTCSNPKEPCGRFFCAECRVGNVCHATFRDGGAHAQHPRIRVWRVTRQFSVCIDDVRRFMPRPLADQIQLYKQNSRHNVKLVKPEPDSKNIVSSRRRICHGSCNDFISSSTIPNHSPHPVCSLKCLLDQLDARAPVVVPRPVVMPAAARPLLIGGAAVESGLVRNDVQGRGDERRKRRKQNKESVVRSDYRAQFIPQE